MAAWDDRITDKRQRRCAYCGAKCKGRACPSHADLLRIEARRTQLLRLPSRDDAVVHVSAVDDGDNQP